MPKKPQNVESVFSPHPFGVQPSMDREETSKASPGIRKPKQETKSQREVSCSNKTRRQPWCWLRIGIVVVIFFCTGSMVAFVWDILKTGEAMNDLLLRMQKMEERDKLREKERFIPNLTKQTPFARTASMTTPMKATTTAELTPLTLPKQIPNTSFRLHQTKQVRYDNVDFLALQVEVPSDGQSKTENWCRDYQYLCEHFSRQPVGCGGFHTRESPFKECIEMYSSYLDPNGVLRCSPTAKVANISIKAFPDISPPPTKGYNAFGFFKCKEYCQKSIKASNSSLSCTKGFWENVNNLTRIMYTVCR